MRNKCFLLVTDRKEVSTFDYTRLLTFGLRFTGFRHPLRPCQEFKYERIFRGTNNWSKQRARMRILLIVNTTSTAHASKPDLPTSRIVGLATTGNALVLRSWQTERQRHFGFEVAQLVGMRVYRLLVQLITDNAPHFHAATVHFVQDISPQRSLLHAVRTAWRKIQKQVLALIFALVQFVRTPIEICARNRCNHFSFSERLRGWVNRLCTSVQLSTWQGFICE